MFQPNIYKLFNNDLKNLNNNQLFIHWKTIGKNEHRISNMRDFFEKYPNFNLENYKINYKDLNDFDDLIVMSHFHHNKNNISNIEINNELKIYSKIQEDISNDFKINYHKININNNIFNYLTKYYKYKYRLSIIIIDEISNFDYNNLNYNYDTYLFSEYINKNSSFININLKFDIYLIQNLIVNLNYDYFLFPKKNIENITSNIEKNPNIIIDDSYIIIKKNYLKYINFFDLYYLNFNYKNIDKVIINNDFFNFKIYNLLNLSLKNDNSISQKKILIDIDSTNKKNLLKIIKIICYLEKNNFNVFIQNNYLNIFGNYSISNDYTINYNSINNIDNIHDSTNLTINNIVDENFICDTTYFYQFKKINYEYINNIFAEILYLDLKKNIILIYLNESINESFIIQSLINLDFLDSIIITINYNKYNLNIFNNLSFIDIDDLIINKNLYNHDDLELFLGLNVDYYIGPVNYLSKIWNYMNNNLILYLPDFDNEYFNNKNIIINNNSISLESLNNCIISYNYSLFRVIDNQLILVNSEFDYYIDYYFNDFIFHIYFNINSVITNYKIDLDLYKNKNIYFIKNIDTYYIKYFNTNIKINNNFIIENYKNYFIDTPLTNKFSNNAINNYVFIIKIYDHNLINYYINIFQKYYLNLPYKIEFFCNKNLKNTSNFDKEKFNINIINNINYNEIFELIISKYTIFDMIYIIKNMNFNIINFEKDILHLIIQNDNNLIFEKPDYFVFNLNIINNNIFKLINILKIKRVFDFIDDIDIYIKNYYNNYYINSNNDSLNIIYDKCVLTKYLIYQTNHTFFNNYDCNLFDIDENNIKLFIFNIKLNLLKIIFNDNKDFSININISNFNIFLNKSHNNYKIIYSIDNDKINYDDINLDNKIIVNKYNEFVLLIIDNNNLKKIGYINTCYFINKLLIQINLFIIKNILNLKFYIFVNDKTLNIDFKFSHKIITYFSNINLKKIINIRNLINLNTKYDNLFDIIILNLKNRTDKKKYMINQMNKLNIINYRFFNAIKISKDELNNFDFIKPEKFLNHLNINYVIGSAGCKISHYEIIKNIQTNNKYTIILEDDVVLEYNFIYYILNSLKQIKNNHFDLLYLGCNLNNKESNELIDENLIKVNEPKTTTAYIIKNSNTSKILNVIENSFNEIDNAYSDSELIKLCIFPMIAYQKNIKSDIISNNEYGYYHDKYYF